MSTANFIVIQDAISQISDDPQYGFPNQVVFPEFDVAGADLGLRPVLTFQLTTGAFVTLTITLNRVEVVSKSISFIEGERMMSEVVNENILQATSNELIASVTGGGYVFISDFVVWYRK